MKKATWAFFSIIIALVLLLVGFKTVYAEDIGCGNDPGCYNQKIQEYEGIIKNLSQQANTLNNQISQFNAQINLTILKISQTEEKITLLGGRIVALESSLNSLSKSFTSRVVETYKMSKMNSPVLLLTSSQSISDAVSKYHYLKLIQEVDRGLLTKLQGAQTSYKGEKAAQEALQIDLTKQKASLSSQKAAKAKLLAATQNDEKKYQQLLSQAKAEYEAIQAIIAGHGQETEVGHIGERAKIASIIRGASCNSEGSHLHFMVTQNGNVVNPFDYLSGIDYENCSGSGCGNSDSDPFNPRGSWSWPINPKIKFNQGYGNTWAVRNTWVSRIYNFHNGIDINSESSSDVLATKPRILYRGSYSGYNSCALRYVRVRHDEGGIETYYLHVNY